jgi:hypothetical protein
VWENKSFTRVLEPGKRQLFWKGPIDVKVEKVDLSASVASKASSRTSSVYRPEKPDRKVGLFYWWT